MISRLALGLAFVLASLGLWVGNTPAAEARTVSSSLVGTIDGEYWVAGKNYDGGFRPVSGRCVVVERKAGGVWRSNVSTTAPGNVHCNSSVTLSWWIHDDTLAVNTEAIQLRVSGSSSRVVLCTSKADCQQT